MGVHVISGCAALILTLGLCISAPAFADESSPALEAVQACVLKKLQPGEDLNSPPSTTSGERFVLAFRLSKASNTPLRGDQLNVYDPNNILKGYAINPGPLDEVPGSPPGEISFVAMKSETIGIVFVAGSNKPFDGKFSALAMEIDRKKPEGRRSTGHTYYGYCKLYMNDDVTEVDAAFRSVKAQPKAMQ